MSNYHVTKDHFLLQLTDPFLVMHLITHRSLLSSITEALEAALVSRTEGVAREKLPISKTVEDTSALAVLVSLYQRYLLSDPVVRILCFRYSVWRLEGRLTLRLTLGDEQKE